MPTTTKRPKKIVAADLNIWAAEVVSRSTGTPVPTNVVEQEKKKIADEKAAARAIQDANKNPAAVALGRLGGLKGGKARADALSPKKRSEIAKKAAAARWDKKARILALTKMGLTSAEVAKTLGINVATVKKSREHLISKLNLKPKVTKESALV